MLLFHVSFLKIKVGGERKGGKEGLSGGGGGWSQAGVIRFSQKFAPYVYPIHGFGVFYSLVFHF